MAYEMKMAGLLFLLSFFLFSPSSLPSSLCLPIPAPHLSHLPKGPLLHPPPLHPLLSSSAPYAHSWLSNYSARCVFSTHTFQDLRGRLPVIEIELHQGFTPTFV